MDVPPRLNRLEGYLFPDTYRIPTNPTPGCIIQRMLQNFVDRMDENFFVYAEERGKTMDEIITIASIIEAETPRADERALVSQVIYSRLEQNILLQMDATVAYALGEHRSRLLRADLQVDSPYNTHIYLGLLIGPIGNPGRASIEAALRPADTNYLFFVVDYADHSRHVFTTNYADHNAAVQRYHASLDRQD